MTQLSAIGPLAETTEPPPKPRSRKRLLAIALGLGVLLAGGAYATHWWQVGRFIEDTDDAYVGGDVTVIAPRVAGYITDVAVHDNQRVRAGDLLFRIDDRDLRAALAKAEGAVAAQEALLANLDATASLQEAVIHQAQASVSAANAETVRSRDDQMRYDALAQHLAVSKESAQRADATYLTAVANTQHGPGHPGPSAAQDPAEDRRIRRLRSCAMIPGAHHAPPHGRPPSPSHRQIDARWFKLRGFSNALSP